jgi:Tfp pilus assembly pilus retraction ATPase PilT
MDQLENAMQSGAASGMRLMDTAILTLLEQRQISGKEAFKKAINKTRFEQYRNAS